MVLFYTERLKVFKWKPSKYQETPNTFILYYFIYVLTFAMTSSKLQEMWRK